MSGEISMSVETAAAENELSEGTIYKAIRDGELRSMKIGRSRRILREDLIAWVLTKFVGPNLESKS